MIDDDNNTTGDEQSHAPSVIDEDDPFAEGEPEPQQDDQPESQGAASAAPASAPVNAMHAVVAAASDQSIKLTSIALRYNVKEDDPAWLLALAVLDTSAAAAQAVGAADKIEKSAAGVGDAIYTQTLRAGNELQGVIKTTLKGQVIETGKSLLRAIEVAADSGAQRIEQASAGLDAAAHQQQAIIMQKWRADLSAAAKAEMKARYAQSWLAITLTLIFMLVAGASLGIGAQYLDGKVLPWGWHVEVAGGGDCGTITTVRGTGEACIANKE